MAKPTIAGKLGFFYDDVAAGEKWIHNGTDWVPWSESAGEDWSFNGTFTPIPTGDPAKGTTADDFKALFFASKKPTITVRASNAVISSTFDGGSVALTSSGFGLYITGTTIAVPKIEGRPVEGKNPSVGFTDIKFFRSGTLYATNATPTANAWSLNVPESTAVTTTVEFSASATDINSRESDLAKGSFTFTLPFFGTTTTISAFTPQPLKALNSTFYQLDMVGETPTEKHTADFPTSFGSLVGIKFFNTVSGSWEWLKGNAAASLAEFTKTSASHVLNGGPSMPTTYDRYTHNGVMTGALKYQFNF